MACVGDYSHAWADSEARIDQILGVHGARHDGDILHRGIYQTSESLYGDSTRVLPRTYVLRVSSTTFHVIEGGAACHFPQRVRVSRIKIGAVNGEGLTVYQ